MVKKIFLLIIIIIIVVGSYNILKQNQALKQKLIEAKNQLETLTKEKNKLESDIKYYQNEANLIKAAQQNLNYKLSNEKTIIIVPATSSTSTNQ
ncbi:MAG: septum formation initiator family protein [Minisyncoccia bacterium]